MEHEIGMQCNQYFSWSMVAVRCDPTFPLEHANHSCESLLICLIIVLIRTKRDLSTKWILLNQFEVT